MFIFYLLCIALLVFVNVFFTDAFNNFVFISFSFKGLYEKGADGTSCHSVKWNSVGNSLMLEKWDIPIFFVVGDDAHALLDDVSICFSQSFLRDS